MRYIHSLILGLLLLFTVGCEDAGPFGVKTPHPTIQDFYKSFPKEMKIIQIQVTCDDFNECENQVVTAIFAFSTKKEHDNILNILRGEITVKELEVTEIFYRFDTTETGGELIPFFEEVITFTFSEALTGWPQPEDENVLHQLLAASEEQVNLTSEQTGNQYKAGIRPDGVYALQAKP